MRAGAVSITIKGQVLSQLIRRWMSDFVFWSTVAVADNEKGFSPARRVLFAPVLGPKGLGTNRAAVQADFLVRSEIEQKGPKE